MQITVAGHLCLDISPHWQRGDLGSLQPGGVVQMDGVTFSTGGAVANTGLCLKRLGFEPTLIARTGDDHCGNIIRTILEQHGVASGFIIKSAETATSYTIVLSPPETDRLFLHYPGSNDEFSLEDIDFDMIKPGLFHFGYPPLMRQMYKEEGTQLQAMFERAKNIGCITSLDMAQPDPNSVSSQLDWEKILARILPFVDIFLPSLEELLFMLNRQKYEALHQGSCSVGTPLLDKLARRLIDLGAAIVGIKLGDQGLYLGSGSRAGQLFGKNWAQRQIHSPIFKVKARSTTGAGDTTIAGLLAGLVKGQSPEQAVTLASAVGACSVEALSAVGGIPSLEEVLARIERGWPKVMPTMETPGWTEGELRILYGPNDGSFAK